MINYIKRKLRGWLYNDLNKIPAFEQHKGEIITFQYQMEFNKYQIEDIPLEEIEKEIKRSISENITKTLFKEGLIEIKIKDFGDPLAPSKREITAKCKFIKQ